MDNSSKLNVRLFHKTIQDYFALMDGFRVVKFRELGVTQEIIEKYPFLEPIKSVPLHIEFVLQKENRYPRNLNIINLSYEECLTEENILKEIIDRNGCVIVDKAPLNKEALIELSSKLGRVNEKRGKVYEVYDRKLDCKQINVLVSATNQSSGYHSDGSDRFYFPRIVGLMCVTQGESGGETKLSNAYKAYIEMKKDYPELVEALSKPIKRMLITTGLGEKKDYDFDKIRENEYPVFVNEPFEFRYMRLWIEMAYQTLKLDFPPLLVEAMNKLEEILQANEKQFMLKSGQILYCVNGLFGHDRTSFVDNESCKRLMWRTWID